MKKIILVEDTNYLQLKLEQALLRSNIMDIESINSRMMTQAYINYLHDDIRLFIIDLDNYNRNGIQLIKLVRDNYSKENVPIIAISRNADVTILKKAVLTGCNDFILKPFEDQSLVFKVRQFFGEKQNTNDSPNQYNPSNIDDTSETTFEWNQDYIINIEEIDNDHRSIIEKYEVLYNLMKDGKGHEYYEELLNYLDEYVNTHFVLEQKLHKEVSYDLSEEHHIIHDEFKNSLSRIVEASKINQPSDVDLININLFIKNWLIHHILIEDKKFGDFMQSKKENTPH
jgi:hemerythrin-like metal-binding protein